MNLRHFAATSDRWIARTARTLRGAVMNMHVPAPKIIVRPLLWLFLALRSTYYFIARVFVCEPLFKAYCTRYGHNLHTGVFVHWVQGSGNIEIGDDVLVDGKSAFGFAARCDSAPTLVIGSRCYIGHGCSFTVGKRITIGNDCRIATGVRMFDASGHPTDPQTRRDGMPTPPEQVRAITLEDNVWIGMNATICPGVTIGENSIVATGSIVTKSVPPNVIVAGNPAAVVRELGQDRAKAVGRS
jgi:acetyltransferase-like isoleucine patch superfamily enzyme